ncbi:MAG: hypothetical protein RIT24_1908 [Planctomycetota bacterium]
MPRTLKIYCRSEPSRSAVVQWLEHYWSDELDSIAVWDADPDDSGTWGIFAEGATVDLKDDLVEVFGSDIEAEWSA